MNRMVIVGCGGLAFHGAQMLSKWLVKRGEAELILIDGDTVEDTNKMRQWCIPGYKTYNMLCLLEQLTDMRSDIKHTLISSPLIPKTIRPLVVEGETLVLCLVDNHRVRVFMDEELRGSKTLYGSAGNNEEGGWVGFARMDTKACFVSEYMREEARREEQHLANPQGCGQLAVEDSQSVFSNMMTMTGMGMVLEDMWQSYVEGTGPLGTSVRWNKKNETVKVERIDIR